ncbi:MAG: MgtC/SapB family protein [Patescibacteria group bacterium]|nr:MgtC/SapB family protein [Patescibacteria group bacterium]MDE1945639.1 MgtC/SapB family protein [Patescibacteria group bacterium]
MFTVSVIVLRLAAAICLGAILGLERTFAGKTAGMRTYAMVAIGACGFILIDLVASSSVFNVAGANPIVIEQAVITGIGFLGAGLVIFQNNKVVGLTTAAGIWVAAAVGIASGFGYFTIALAITLAALVIFTILKFIEVNLERFGYKSIRQADENGEEK